jgi:hypothetical protein
LNISRNDDHNEFNEVIHFEINDDFTVRDNQETIFINEDSNTDSSNNNEDKENRWSFDISNACKENDNRYFIFVAVSNIDDEDMKRINDEDINDEVMKSKTKKRKDRKEASTAIYRIELVKKEKGNHDFDTKNIIVYYTIKISGICKFIHESKSPSSEINLLGRFMQKFKNEVSTSSESNKEAISPESNTEYFSLRRFIILNFGGINSFHCGDNFNLYKVFDYPRCTERALSITSKTSDCINLLLSCIYDKYFLVEHYEDNVQVLEGNN